MKTSLLKRIILPLLFFLILSIFCFIYALIIKNNNYSENSIRLITFVIGMVSFFIYGILTGLIYKKNGLIEGLLNATIVILISLIVNLFTKNAFEFTNIIKIIAYLVICSIGSIIGVNIIMKKQKE